MSDPSERLARLEARIAELEARRQPRRLRMPRGGRRLLAIGLALTLMIPTGVVMATHQFGDVPESNTFHGNIGTLAESGVTAGCGGGNYCPKGNVTREQMAGYLTRGLGRAARADASITFAQLLAGTPMAEVTLRTGGVQGGTGFVLVTAAGRIQATDGVCPCDVGMVIKAGSEYSAISTAVARTKIGSGWWVGDATLTWVFEVPSGTDATFQLLANSIVSQGGSANSYAAGMISAVYIPFGSDGGSTLGASAPSLQGTDAIPALSDPAPEGPAQGD
jgi:hypothetical protein